MKDRLQLSGPAAVAAARMREAGQTESAIRAFVSALERVRAGADTLIPSESLAPAPDVPRLEDLPAADDADALARLAVIRLNGGLATSMGLRQPKSLLQAREGLTFMDVMIEQILVFRQRHGVRLPLILMDSDATHQPTIDAMAGWPDIATAGVPPDFLQSMVPKLDEQTWLPARWPAAPSLEWCPPGHGDVYASLVGSGVLDALLAGGFRYVMIANSDNLGAVADPRIATYMAAERIPFLMEVVRGTVADRKGGHIALRVADGRLVLRETAQTPAQDQGSFRDYRRWRYYNTNSLWLDLRALARQARKGAVLELPVIVNRKTIDPRDPTSMPVVQLESAMGAAIASFPGARVLEVPRARFVPVKTTDDLLLLRSDFYALSADFEVRQVNPDLPVPYVALDRDHYGLIDDFEQRFPSGPPSLKGASCLVVDGDVTFGAGVVVSGDVRLDSRRGRLRIADGMVLSAADGDLAAVAGGESFSGADRDGRR
ncbi:MAG: UTP--glucose-1-phosphate uridylyltransferase [Solirubrobacteraceae bacterium]